ncbi:MAG TPA: hypothetical protein ENK86_05295 [Campylobacterales bacterium]|nr:hypothetical protein [Campylobacterales bacterium]
MQLPKILWFFLGISLWLWAESNQTTLFAETNQSREEINTSLDMLDSGMTLDDVQSSLMGELVEAQETYARTHAQEIDQENRRSLLEDHIENSSLIMVAQVETNSSESNGTHLLSFKPVHQMKGDDLNGSVQLRRALITEAQMHDHYLLFLVEEESNASLYALTDSNNSALIIKDDKVHWRYRALDRKPEKSISDVIEQIEEIVTPPEEVIPEC